ncbi:MAG TPA: Maf family protein [Planctomycetaceae bacterium]|nr:Maf family protein [Planctomycetaceae bacterium]
MTSIGADERIAAQIVLASRSPRRRELLGLVVPREHILVVPPRSADEAGFEGLHERLAIEIRLADIGREKAYDVSAQLALSQCDDEEPRAQLIVAADTAVVVSRADGRLLVLGQPPSDETWADVVRHWFREHYASRTHEVLTALCVVAPDGRKTEQIVSTSVTFVADVESRLEWYIQTGEPRGKAGGYGIQGAGSIFISSVSGSLSNVIGLPLEALLDLFAELGIPIAGTRTTERQIWQ